MTATEDLTRSGSVVIRIGPDGRHQIFRHGELITSWILTDDEWRILDLGERLGELLDVDDAVVRTPVGRLMHDADVELSPFDLWRSRATMVMRFRTRRGGLVPMSVGVDRIGPTGDRWLLVADEAHVSGAPAVEATGTSRLVPTGDRAFVGGDSPVGSPPLP